MAGEPIYYVPWVPREGMAGTYEALYKAWGLPHFWPEAVRDVVCRQGKAVALLAGVPISLKTGDVVLDEAVSPGEVQFRVGNRIVGRIVNIGPC